MTQCPCCQAGGDRADTIFSAIDRERVERTLSYFERCPCSCHEQGQGQESDATFAARIKRRFDAAFAIEFETAAQLRAEAAARETMRLSALRTAARDYVEEFVAKLPDLAVVAVRMQHAHVLVATVPSNHPHGDLAVAIVDLLAECKIEARFEPMRHQPDVLLVQAKVPRP